MANLNYGTKISYTEDISISIVLPKGKETSEKQAKKYLIEILAELNKKYKNKMVFGYHR